MSDSAEGQEGGQTSETKFVLWRKSIWDHAKGVLAKWWLLPSAMIAGFGIAWTIAEAASTLFDVSMKEWPLYVAVLSLTLVLALGYAVKQYVTGCPEGLDGESAAARRLAQLQPPRWEFRLARQLLRDKLLSLDVELEDLLAGRVFVPIEKSLSIPDFLGWSELRPANVIRMATVSKQLIAVDLPASMAATGKQPADPRAILAIADRIRELYLQTIVFERTNHSVSPPSGFESLHALQFNWTEPVRSALRQLLDFLDTMIEADLEGGFVSFKITYETPPNVDAFNDETDRLRGELGM